MAAFGKVTPFSRHVPCRCGVDQFPSDDISPGELCFFGTALDPLGFGHLLFGASDFPIAYVRANGSSSHLDG